MVIQWLLFMIVCIATLEYFTQLYENAVLLACSRVRWWVESHILVTFFFFRDLTVYTAFLDSLTVAVGLILLQHYSLHLMKARPMLTSLHLLAAEKERKGFLSQEHSVPSP